MRLYLIYFFFHFIFCSSITIDLITTNDMHGFINEQKAYFMNPQYPPTIIGGSGFYKYINDLKQTSNDEDLLMALDYLSQIRIFINQYSLEIDSKSVDFDEQVMEMMNFIICFKFIIRCKFRQLHAIVGNNVDGSRQMESIIKIAVWKP